MLIHYLKLARKSLIKHKYYTFINVAGLVCGMLSALIIAKYIGASLEFDSFHANKDYIYVLSQEERVDGSSGQKQQTTYPGVANLITQFPDAGDFTRYAHHVEALVIAEEQNGSRRSFTESKIFIADSSFFKVFTLPFIHGNPETALSSANAIVLTRSSAQRYFGDANPVGQLLTVRVSWGKQTVYKVTGVAEDIPALSRFEFDFLLSQPDSNTDELWLVPACSIYVLLKENADPIPFADKLTKTVNEVPQLKAANRSVMMSLDAISRMDLSTEEYLLATIAIFITLISWVNYINQIIAQSYWRVKQVGISRIMGATGHHLRMQSFVESTIVCATSFCLVIGIYAAFEPALQNFANGHLLPLTGDPTMANFIFVGVFVCGIMTAGAVQTIIHSSQGFGRNLQTFYQPKIGGVALRKALVILQFSISTVLIVSVFVISNQLAFLQSKDKGFNPDDVLVIKAPMAKDTTWYVKRRTLELFKQRCRELSFVTDVTSSTTIPGEEYRHETYLSFQGSTHKAFIHQNGVDERFFDFYDVKFIYGHDFIPDANAQNRNSIILNKSAAKALGISDLSRIMNTKVIDHEDPEVIYDLIGIVNDYHKTSAKYEIKPMAFKFNVFRGHSSLKINATALTESTLSEKLDRIKEIWKDSYPDASFDPFFLDDKFDAQHLQDRQFGKLFKYFAILSVIISDIGLFGLSLLISTKRQKEVGIRKTFGASSTAILAIFLKGYIKPLSISLLIGSSIAYLMMSRWLENYAYRIEIGAGLIALSVGTLTAIFFFTVSFSTLKSALTNPIKVLRE